MFSPKRELQGLELPKGTVIEVELTKELQGEVSLSKDMCVVSYTQLQGQVTCT